MNKKSPSEMTRKQALSILHKAHDAVGWHLYDPAASEEERTIRGQLHDAFRVLDRALHGEEARYCPLCAFCYLYLCPDDYIQACAKGKHSASPCCAQCLEQLKTTHQLKYIEVWNTEQSTWEQKEVPQ